MDQQNVPQDEENLHEGKVAKLYYATDSKGHYVKVNSIGWEPETVAMKQAWEVVNEEVEAAKLLVKEGKASPIFYFMKKNIMTVPLVADYVGKLSFIVRLHMKPTFFKKLSQATLKKYADTFRITVEELTDINKIIS
jgi:hypothetical protein